MVPRKISTPAAKIEDKQLRNYELVLIVNPEVVDEALDAMIDSISQLIIGKDGVISDVERWGKRKLAYPIEHFEEGSYVLIKCTLKPTVTRDIESTLRISEKVLRHLLVNIE